jgi:threonine dehydrogenase-like Zn-dependent dehydrogenase
VQALVLDREPRLVPDHPEPRRTPGEALVRMRLAGICDTDLQLARGYLGYRGVLGHEFVGEVLECDDPRWLGRRVVADINAGCGQCADCTERDGHHCAERTVLGITGRDGALAERLVVPDRCLIEVPGTVPDELAVFAEPLAAAAHVLDEASGGPAIVLGDGKLGLLIAMVLAASGIPTTLIGHHADKVAIAARVGVNTLLEGTVAPAPLVVEATGSAGGLARALDLVLPRGTVVLKTTVADPIQIDLAPIVIHEVRVVGSRCGDLHRALGLLAERRVDPTPLVAGRYPLARAVEALRHAATEGVLKVLIDGPAVL